LAHFVPFFRIIHNHIYINILSDNIHITGTKQTIYRQKKAISPISILYDNNMHYKRLQPHRSLGTTFAIVFSKSIEETTQQKEFL